MLFDKLRRNNKGVAGSLNAFVTLGVGIFVVGIVLTFLGLVSGSVRDQLVDDDDAELIANQTIAAGNDLADFLSPVALVGVAVVIIGMIVGGIGIAGFRS